MTFGSSESLEMDPEKKYEPNLDPNKVKWGFQKQGHLMPVAWRAHVAGKAVLYPPCAMLRSISSWTQSLLNLVIFCFIFLL